MTTIDESLYSRQMYVYGESMKKICDAKVLLLNPMALGVEVAKNLILSGIKQLDIIGHGEVVDELQYGVNMYVSKEDIGKNLSDVVVPKLKELNPYVSVNVISSVSIDQLKQYQAIVVLDKTYDKQFDLNNVAHKLGIPYISGNTYGLTGVVFSDFGEKFPVHDATGENVNEVSIGRAYIQSSDKGDLWLVETGEPHNMSDGDHLTLHNTQQDITKGPYKIVNTTRSKDGSVHTLQITELDGVESSKSFEPTLFNKYGELKEVKQTQYLSFKTLKESCKTPDYASVFYEQMERQETLHATYQMFSAFYEKYDKFPEPFSQADYLLLMEFNKTNKYCKEIDEEIVKLFINRAGVIPAVISVIGSIISQEVLKSVTNKYMPIKQFMYFESFNSLPKFVSKDDHNYDESLDRYSYMVNVFGKEFMNKMLNLNMFMVGCGAIGCELLKNFALMGVACGDGTLTVTDPDTIERSNLNRQFLFRTKNIGQFKSEAAAVSIKDMNPDINITPHQNKVGPESENVYNYGFYSNLNIVANALDNVKARRYVDEKCVENGLPLLESGTLGVKGNVQVVVPFKSESYGSSSDPPEKDIPVCTLKNFPFQIEHTSHWALDLFKCLFSNASNNINRFIENPEFVLQLESDELTTVHKDLIKYGIEEVPSSAVDAIIIGVKHFNYYFNDVIVELLKQFPADSTTSSGLPFWSGSKRCPKPIPFNVNNRLHMEFVKHFTKLYLNMYNIEDTTSITDDLIISTISNVSTPLTYEVTEKFAANDEEEKANQEKKKANTNERYDILNELSHLKPKLKVKTLKAEEFEKDDDSNHHIDWISSVANLRASNYHIQNADRHKIKGIVGRIIPAVATTTSLVAGLVSLELCKFVAGHTDLNMFRNAFINLGIGFMAFSDPMPASVQKLGDKEFTMWDQLDVRGDMTMGELRHTIKQYYGYDVDAVNFGKKSLFRSYGNLYKPEVRDKEMMSEIFTSMKIPIQTVGESYTPLSIMLDVDDEFEEPDVRYWL